MEEGFSGRGGEVPMIHGHGGDVYSLARELQKDPLDILDFSSNISPMPIPTGIKDAIVAHLEEVRMLPEVDSFSLRKALGIRYGLDPDQFLVGSGTTEWIYALPKLLEPDRVVIPLPTYSDYEDASLMAERDVDLFVMPLPAEGIYSSEQLMESLLSRVGKGNREVIFLCNPNNPTGAFTPPELIREACATRPNSIWIIDESYAHFVAEDDKSSLLGQGGLPSNAIILRSFSKIYSIPGLRIGCIVGPKEIISGLSTQARPWAVNRLAQVAGEYLISHPSIEDEVRRYCANEKAFILAQIQGLGDYLEPIEGTTNFILFRVKEPYKAAQLTGYLRSKGILIRNCGNFKGLYGEYIRISIKDRLGNEILIESLSDFFRGVSTAGG